MPDARVPHRDWARRYLTSKHAVSRRMLMWLLIPLLLVLAVPAFLAVQSSRSGAAPLASSSEQARNLPREPADRFMQSVVTDDGALGWQQLCPELQAQLPKSELVQQASAERTAVVKQGVRMTFKLVGVQARQDGGVVRVYIVTARWPNGTTQTRNYAVLTQASGCVEDVQSQDVQSQ